MKTTEDLRARLVQLVSEAKSDKAAAKMGGRRDAVKEGLKAYGRGVFNAGKFLS